MGATLHCGVWASHYRGLPCCGAQAPDAQAQQLWLTGLVALRHVGSSQTRARTRVPCIGRQIPNHRATREAPTGRGILIHYATREVPFWNFNSRLFIFLRGSYLFRLNNTVYPFPCFLVLLASHFFLFSSHFFFFFPRLKSIICAFRAGSKTTRLEPAFTGRGFVISL